MSTHKPTVHLNPLEAVLYAHRATFDTRNVGDIPYKPITTVTCKCGWEDWYPGEDAEGAYKLFARHQYTALFGLLAPSADPPGMP